MRKTKSACLPVALSQWKEETEFLMKFTELFV